VTAPAPHHSDVALMLLASTSALPAPTETQVAQLEGETAPFASNVRSETRRAYTVNVPLVQQATRVARTMVTQDLARLVASCTDSLLGVCDRASPTNVHSLQRTYW